MQTTNDFLNSVKSLNELTSDYQLAGLLGITRSQISKYRHNKDFLGDESAIKVAEALKIDPAYVVACVHFERTKKDSERAVWKSIIQRLGGLASAILLTVTLSYAPPDMAGNGEISFTNNVDALYIMRSGNPGNQVKPLILFLMALFGSFCTLLPFFTRARSHKTFLLISAFPIKKFCAMGEKNGQKNDHAKAKNGRLEEKNRAVYRPRRVPPPDLLHPQSA